MAEAVAAAAFVRWIDANRTPAQKQAIDDVCCRGLAARVVHDTERAACRWRAVSPRLVRR